MTGSAGGSTWNTSIGNVTEACDMTSAVSCDENTGQLNGSSSSWSNNTTRYIYGDIRQITLAVYLLTFVFGLVGNTLVIYVIAKYHKIRSRSVSNYYIWNLAFADELFVLTLPFHGYATYASNWPFDTLSCKVATVFRECNKFASVYTLVALSIDRFLATFHQFGRFRQIRSGLAACAAIWTICLILSTPFWLFSHVVLTSRNQFSCKVQWPSMTVHRIWTYSSLVAGLLAPFIVIATFSLLLLRRVRGRTGGAAGQSAARASMGGGGVGDMMSASRLERLSRLNSSMTRVVLVIVVMFGVCQLPYHVMEVTSLVVIDRMSQDPPQRLSPTTEQALIYCNVVVQILVFLSSCCNPIVYGILNKNYRKLSTVTYSYCACGLPSALVWLPRVAISRYLLSLTIRYLQLPSGPDSIKYLSKPESVAKPSEMVAFRCFTGTEVLWQHVKISLPRQQGSVGIQFEFFLHVACPCWSVAVSTITRHSSRSYALCLADLRPQPQILLFEIILDGAQPGLSRTTARSSPLLRRVVDASVEGPRVVLI